MGSIDSVNFSLRPNKAVERKLVFGALRALEPAFSLRSYRYVGLGGIWFSDFVLAHRTLRIDSMNSIEEESNAAERARFNRPYATIDVSAGLSTEILPTLDLGSRRSIAWMDYDTDITGPVLNDIPILAESLPAGSIVLLTINAHPNSLGTTYEEKRDTLYKYAAGYYEAPAPESFFRARRTAFPMNVAKILLARLERDVRQRSGHNFYPLFNFSYADGAPMVTVGGMLVDGNASDLLRATRITTELGVTAPTQFHIELPVLTRREKLYLDRLLPRDPPLTDATLVSAQGRPATLLRERFMLTPGEVSAYTQLYPFYPLYSEAEP